MSNCKAHGKPYTFLCRELDCGTTFICDHPDCLNAHHHNHTLKIYSIKKLREAATIDSEADRPIVDETKFELDNYFEMMKNELLVQIAKLQETVHLEVEKIAMQLCDIDFGIKDAHRNLIEGKLDAIQKQDALKLASSMKAKLDFAMRKSMYQELKNEVVQRISRSDALLEGLSKSTAFTQVFKFKSSYKGPKIVREVRRHTSIEEQWTHSPEKSDALKLTVKENTMLKGITLYEITDWNNSEIILLTLQLKGNGRTVVSQEIILSKEIHSGREIDFEFKTAAKLTPGTNYDIIITNMGEFYKSRFGRGPQEDEILSWGKSTFDNNGSDESSGQFAGLIIETL